MKKLCFIYFILIFFLSQCTSIPTTRKERQDQEKIDSGNLKIALVLDGIGVHGFSGIGVLRVLEKERIPIHMIVGSHMGAFVGALYAESQNSFSVEWNAMQLELKNYFTTSLFSERDKAYASLFPLKKYIIDKIKTPKVEELPLEFMTTTTNLSNGQSFTFDKGLVDQAILASSAIPGFFPPVHIESQTLVSDFSSFQGIQIAKERGAHIIIAVIPKPSLENYNLKDQKDIILQAYHINRNKNVNHDFEDADILLSPDIKSIQFDDFSKKRACIYQGTEAATEVIDRIKTLIERKR